MHDHSLFKSAFDWLLTLLVALYGFVVSMLDAKDLPTILSVALLLVKLAHEAFRFWQSWRRSRLQRRLADSSVE